MILTNDMYVPALRWRQAEYQALLRLADPAKDRTAPYITIPEIEFDFEEQRPKKTVQEHVHPFALRYKAKWGRRRAWISVTKNIVDIPMDDGRDIFTYVFGELRGYKAMAVPAVPVDASASTLRAVATILDADSLGTAIAIRLEDLMRPGLRVRIDEIMSNVGAAPAETDLVIDLGAPNFQPYDIFSDALIAAVRLLGDLNDFRNLVLIATAIPATFRDVARGGDEIPRHDWMFYRTLITKLPEDMRCPSFGDYTIVHPDFAPIDMRMIKSAGKLVYTTSSSWVVRKGRAFRDNPEQMHDHCASIVSSRVFKGPSYSSGDAYIAKCALRVEGPSNQTRWKEVAINHHITHALEDLATLDAAP